jgi:hypothetical protein
MPGERGCDKAPPWPYTHGMGVSSPARVALLALVALTASVVWMDVERVGACSCVRQDPREWLADGKPAVIGEVVSKRPVGGEPGPTYEYRVRVERQFNADLGAEITLTSASTEAACGFEWNVGQRVGAFLRRDGARWTTNLCLLVEPQKLEEGLLPFPEPLGRGRAVLLAAGDFGAARLMALDGRGRIVAYGKGQGATRQVSVCPGSRRLLELVDRGRGARLAVRAMRSMRVLRSVSVPRASHALRCQDPAGRLALVSTYERRRGQTVARVLHVRGHRVDVAGMLPGEAVALGRRVAYVAGRDTVAALDLATGRTRTVGRVRWGTQIALSPGGRRVAVVDSYGVRLIDLATGRTRVDPVGQWGPIAWLGRDRLLARLGGGRIRIYDAGLRALKTHGPYRAVGFARLGRRVFGINGALLVALDLVTGARRTVSELPDEDIYDLDALPSRPRISAPGSRATLSRPGRCRAQTPYRGGSRSRSSR